MTDDTKRAEYIEGLRRLANILERTDLELPTHSDIRWLLFGEGEENQKERAAEIVRTVGGKWDKHDAIDLFWFGSKLAGLKVEVTVNRESVCRRVIKGSREVQEQVPATFTTVTKTVEDVEWICEPLLGSEKTLDSVAVQS